MMYDKAMIEDLFSYHPPTPEQATRYLGIRQAAKDFANILCDLTPAGADQSAAIRKLRECVMTANAAIALYGTPGVERINMTNTDGHEQLRPLQADRP